MRCTGSYGRRSAEIGNRRLRAKCAPKRSPEHSCVDPSGPIGPAAKVHHGRRRQWLCLNVPPPSPLPPAPIRSLPPTLSDNSTPVHTGRRVHACGSRLRHGSAALACSSRSAEPSRSSIVCCGTVGHVSCCLPCGMLHATCILGAKGVCCAPCVITGVCCRAGACSRRSS
jgi:hypothetical protein